MPRPVFRALVALAAAIAMLPAAAAAQKVSISPTIGVYIPTTELLKAANGEEFKQEVGLAVGGRLGVHVSPRFGILTTVTYVPSDLKIDLATGEQVKNNANLLFGSLRATYFLLPITSPVWFSLSGGGSYVRRSGDAYANAQDKDDIGGVAGATLGFRLGSMLSFYVAADDYIYGTRIDETTLEADKKTQNDVHLSLGFGIPLGR
jgi:Outer membrane protein beta-barrel domain